MKKNRGDKLIQLIIHIYMEMSQENFLYSYIKQKCLFILQKQKTGRQNRSSLGGC
jgi:hypothetical protein